jgi:hypothetical protein
MKNITGEVAPWLARRTSRRTFLGKSTGAAFGVMAGLAVGAPRFKNVPDAAPCGPSPNCRSYSSSFCGPGSTGTNCESGSAFSCSKRNSGCTAAGDYCWYNGSIKCCDCTCSWFGGGSGTVACICWS